MVDNGSPSALVKLKRIRYLKTLPQNTPKPGQPDCPLVFQATHRQRQAVPATEALHKNLCSLHNNLCTSYGRLPRRGLEHFYVAIFILLNLHQFKAEIHSPGSRHGI
jgi:hypothetical protein